MTIQNILRHHGYNCSRRVLPSGRVEFDTTRSVAGPAAGLALTSHTFHGGDEPTDIENAFPWWLADNALNRDVAAMSEYFPTFVEIPGDADQAPAWCGAIHTRLGAFEIAVVHRFDHGLPHVVPMRPFKREKRLGRRVVTSPHTYINGNLCVAASEDWNPDRDTVATVVAWAAHWHAFYTEWFFTGKWPAERYVAESA